MRHNNYPRPHINQTKFGLAPMLQHGNLDELVLYEIAVRLNIGKKGTFNFFSALLPAYGLAPDQVKAMFGF